MEEIDFKPLLQTVESMAGKCKRFARAEEAMIVDQSVAEMRASLERFTLAKGRLFSVAKGIEARLSKDDPELGDVITSGPVS